MLIPLVDMEKFEKIGFKKCKEPYNECYYLNIVKKLTNFYFINIKNYWGKF